jgi:hypothetical protein
MESGEIVDAYRGRYPGKPKIDVRRFFQRGLRRSLWFWWSLLLTVGSVAGWTYSVSMMGWTGTDGAGLLFGLTGLRLLLLAVTNYRLLRDLIPDWGDFPIRGPLSLALELAADQISWLALGGSFIIMLSCSIGPAVWYARHGG